MFLWLPTGLRTLSKNNDPPQILRCWVASLLSLSCITICSNPPLAPVAYIVVADWRTTRLIANKPFQGRVSRTRLHPSPVRPAQTWSKGDYYLALPRCSLTPSRYSFYLLIFFDNSIMGVMHVWCCVCVIAWSVGPMLHFGGWMAQDYFYVIHPRDINDATTMQWSFGGGGQERADGDLSRRHCKRRRLSSADRKLGNKHLVRNIVRRRNA